MLAQFKVSRPTLRESIRILESHGVVTLRPGPKGGVIIPPPGVDFVAHALSVFLRLNNVPFVAILRARIPIEPALVRDAALHAPAKDFQRLDAPIDRLAKIGNEPNAFAKANLQVSHLIHRGPQNLVNGTYCNTNNP